MLSCQYFLTLLMRQAEALVSFGVHASGANISKSLLVAVSSSGSRAVGDSQESSQVL
jgi:hypothetical protein